MNRFRLIIISVATCAFSGAASAQSVMITGQTAGPTPFIAQIQLTANPPASVKSIEFLITPKAGSVTRPVKGTYPIEYLVKRGYFNSQTGAILLPVFGLYANYSNTVNLTYRFTNNTSQQASTLISTPVFTPGCGAYTSPTVIQPRTNSTALSYDYFLVKTACGTAAPVIIDTDGHVRWVGTAGVTNGSATLFQNSVFLAGGTVLYRIELDGTFTALRDFNNGVGVTNFHHNIDFGKRGMILAIDNAAQVESINLEVDAFGNILRTWNLADIITAAMTAGGDDATQFVRPASDPVPANDWFHNNAVAYKESDDSLLVSSRENFVVALDYNTNAIKWIFGDTTKHWYQFASLRNFALALDVATLPPIGQHALSITSDDNLLLFDNGRSSASHTPPGIDRLYSAPRKYHVNTKSRVATELWNYESNQAFYSPFCSSIYEDSPLNYLIDYSVLGFGSPTVLAEILGLDSSGNKIFHYRYPTTNCQTAWNVMPVHLEQAEFTTLALPTVVSRKEHGASGAFDIPLPLSGSLGVECRSGGNYQVVATFPVPVTITDAIVAPGTGGTASTAGAPLVSGNQVTVNLTNVSHGQEITLSLVGVNDGRTTENISVPMGVLIGDVTGDQSVNATDVSSIKSRSGVAVGPLNFRRDVAASGSINGTDVSVARLNSGSSIPQESPDLID